MTKTKHYPTHSHIHSHYHTMKLHPPTLLILLLASSYTISANAKFHYRNGNRRNNVMTSDRSPNKLTKATKAYVRYVEEFHKSSKKSNKIAPSSYPSVSHQPSANPTSVPTMTPSISHMPSLAPSDQPTGKPSPSPSHQPSLVPSPSPSDLPSATPSVSPTGFPTVSSKPSTFPSASPTGKPSLSPSAPPTTRTSVDPSRPTLSYCSSTGNIESTDDDNELIVGFYYGMILKGGSSSAADALSALESAMSSNLLDSLLECEDGNDGRQLRSNSIRRRLRTIALDTLPADAINDEESCDSTEENTTCVVIDGAVTLYSDYGVINEDVILQSIDNTITQMAYDSSVHPNIVDVKFRGKRVIAFSAAGGDSAGSSASGTGIFDFTGDNIAGAFLLGFLFVAFVSIIVFAVKFDHRRRRNNSEDLSDLQKEEWFNLDDNETGAFPVNVLSEQRTIPYDTSDINSKYSNEFHMGSDADSDGWERSEISASPESKLSNPMNAWDTLNADTAFNQGSDIEVKVNLPEVFGFPHNVKKISSPDTVNL